MKNIDLIGVDTSFSPLSNSFSIDIINEKFHFKNNILNINRATLYIQSEFINSFVVLDTNYSGVYLNIGVRFDYICDNNSVNYELFTIHKLLNICNKDIKFDKKATIYSKIIDADVLNTNQNEVDFYILIGCCLC